MRDLDDFCQQAWLDEVQSAQALVGILLLDQRGQILHANPALCEWLARDASELRSLNIRDLLNRGARLFYDTQLEPMMRLHRSWREVALELLLPQSGSLPVLTSAAERDNGEESRRIVVTMFRATERRRYEQELLRMRQVAEANALALFDEKERARVTLDSLGEGVLVVDADGCITYLNPAAERLTGIARADAAGRAVESVLPLMGEIDGASSHPVRLALSQPGAAGELSGLLPAAGREPRAVEGTVARIRARNGQPGGAVAVLRDVTEARSLHRRLTYQATHDILTGLPNRAEFERAMDDALAEVRGGRLPHVLLFLDLDGFKMVNDTCGHVAGDELLRQVGRLLASKARASDTLARIGGDEFGILLRQCPLEDGERVAQSIVDAMAGFRFSWQSHFFRIGVSIGVAALDEHSPDGGQALSAADSACGWAKDGGRNQVQVFRRDDLQQLRLHEQKDWLAKLNRALARDTLELFMQRINPIGPVPDGIDRFEVLLRMREDDGRLVSPGLFLPVAERYRLMVRIDEWVVSQLFARLSPQVVRVAGRLQLSVNLSGASVNDPAFLEFLLGAFRRHGIPGTMISFEITETVAIANFTQAVEFIHRLASIGCRFALDDFGSGLSSFDYLRKLPVNVVKIDGSFVDGLASDPIKRAMVEAIVRVGVLMKLEIVAERVECEADLQALREMGVDYVQGYVLHRPEPLVVG